MIYQYHCLKPGELLVKVEVAALNYSDLLMINDTYQIKPPKPFTPGQEIAGKVVKVGEGVMFDVGQRIASKVLFGGFAEYAIVRADMVIAVPETIALSSAVTLPVSYTTAMVAFTKVLKVHNNDYVLITLCCWWFGFWQLFRLLDIWEYGF